MYTQCVEKKEAQPSLSFKAIFIQDLTFLVEPLEKKTESNLCATDFFLYLSKQGQG